jgi:hypothetical protein
MIGRGMSNSPCKICPDRQVHRTRTRHPERKHIRICMRGLKTFAYFYPQQWLLYQISNGFVLVQVQFLPSSNTHLGFKGVATEEGWDYRCLQTHRQSHRGLYPKNRKNRGLYRSMHRGCHRSPTGGCIAVPLGPYIGVFIGAYSRRISFGKCKQPHRHT